MYKPWERFDIGTGYGRMTPRFMGVIEAVVVGALVGAGAVTGAVSAAVVAGIATVAGAATMGAAIGAGMSSLAQLITTGKIDWDKVGQGTWMGAAMGGGVSAIGQTAAAVGITQSASQAAAAADATQAARAGESSANTLATVNEAGKSTLELAQAAAKANIGLDPQYMQLQLVQNGVDEAIAGTLSQPAVANALASGDSVAGISAAQNALASTYTPTLAQQMGNKMITQMQKAVVPSASNALSGLVSGSQQASAMTKNAPRPNSLQQTTGPMVPKANAPTMLVMGSNSLAQFRPISRGTF